eukprot:1094627-Rhodomonas_salina.1
MNTTCPTKRAKNRQTTCASYPSMTGIMMSQKTMLNSFAFLLPTHPHLVSAFRDLVNAWHTHVVRTFGCN